MTHDAQNADERLRAELLTSALYDDVSLGDVQGAIAYLHLVDTDAAEQDLALRAIRAGVEDGLMEFVGWEELPLDAAMARVYDLYVTNYEDPGAWAFAIWLRLTAAGKRVAMELEAQKER